MKSKSLEIMDIVERSMDDVVPASAKTSQPAYSSVIAQRDNPRQRNLIQYTGNANQAVPVGNIVTFPKLEAGCYKIRSGFGSVTFEKHHGVSDELIRFKDPQYMKMVEELEAFWNMKDDFKKYGFTHTDALLMHGWPGMGKSCLIKIMTEHIVGLGDIVFSVDEIYDLVAGLKQFREVEPDRKAIVVLEDVDGMINYSEQKLLELMDGDSQIDGVMYVATTNYLERIPERLRRAGRFSRLLEVKAPPKEGRKAYLMHKLGTHEAETSIDQIVEMTDGLGFNHLKQLILSVFVHKNNLQEVVRNLKKGVPGSKLSNQYLDHKIAEAYGLKVEPKKRLSLNEGKAAQVLKEFRGTSLSSFKDEKKVKEALADKLEDLGFEGVSIDGVFCDPDGDVVVTFLDEDGNKMDVLFGLDDEDSGCFAMILHDYTDKDEILLIDLDPIDPPVYENEFGTISVDLIDLDWMNKSTIETILKAGGIADSYATGAAQPEEDEVANPDEPASPQQKHKDSDTDSSTLDAFGYPITKYEGNDYQVARRIVDGVRIEDAFRRVMRGGGKAVKLPILKMKSKKTLTAKQRMSLAKSEKKEAGMSVSLQLRRKVVN